jgi:hypothetical protein
MLLDEHGKPVDEDSGTWLAQRTIKFLDEGSDFRIKNGKAQVKIGVLCYSLLGVLLNDGVTVGVTLNQTGEEN